MFYLSLQNGSDIRGVALEGIAGQSVNLTETVCRNIASAFVCWLSEHCKKEPADLRIGIGRDSRLSGPSIVSWAADAMAKNGAHVFDCSMASTPAMFMSTVTPNFEFDGAIMVTASHLPFNRNGFKFFTRDGGLEKADVQRILQIAESTRHEPEMNGSIESIDFISVYAAQLVALIRKEVQASQYEKPLAGFHIVVDAGNGAGGFFVENVLQPLGANTEGSQFLDPDGRFPNHIPNPEDKEAMAAISSAVLAQHADLGIIFDTDVDRAGAVDENGRAINRNRLIAMISAILLEEFPGTTIVTDSITSSGLGAFIASLGGVHHRFKRGYKNVINEAIRLNANGQDAQLAIETSGHGALKENYFLDDGAYLITKLLIKMARMREENKKLSSLIDALEEPAESVEFRMNITEHEFAKAGERIISELEHHAQKQKWQLATDNHEGIRVRFGPENGNGWFLLRLSLHDPLMPLNIESDTVGGCKIIAQALLPFLKQYRALDVTPLAEFCES